LHRSADSRLEGAREDGAAGRKADRRRDVNAAVRGRGPPQDDAGREGRAPDRECKGRDDRVALRVARERSKQGNADPKPRPLQSPMVRNCTGTYGCGHAFRASARPREGGESRRLATIHVAPGAPHPGEAWARCPRASPSRRGARERSPRACPSPADRTRTYGIATHWAFWLDHRLEVANDPIFLGNSDGRTTKTPVHDDARSHRKRQSQSAVC
jgi:hypothetical protein